MGIIVPNINPFPAYRAMDILYSQNKTNKYILGVSYVQLRGDYKAKFSNIPRCITHQECGFIPGFTLGVAKA